MRIDFSDAFELDDGLSIINELNFYKIPATRGLALKVDGLANLETEGKPVYCLLFQGFMRLQSFVFLTRQLN